MRKYSLLLLALIGVFMLTFLASAQSNEYYIYSSKLNESFRIVDFGYSIEKGRIYFDVNLSNNLGSDRLIKFNFYNDGVVRSKEIVLGGDANSDYKISFPFNSAESYRAELDDGDTNFQIYLNSSSNELNDNANNSPITGNVIGNESSSNYGYGWIYGILIAFTGVFVFYRMKKRKERIKAVSGMRNGRFIELR